MEVSKSEFKAKALEYFRQIEATGEPCVVTDRGEPKLEVRKFSQSGTSPLEVLKGSVLKYENPTEPIGEHDWDLLR